MSEIRVKTTNSYNRLMEMAEKENYEFSGKIVGRDRFNKHKILVQTECGCSKWFDVSDVKPANATCDH